MDEAVAARLGEAFALGSGHGLLRLGAGEVGQALPPVFVWWRGFAARYVTALCVQGVGTTGEAVAAAAIPDVPTPSEGELATLVLTAPMMAGAEYLTTDVLRALWAEIGQAVSASVADRRRGLAELPQGAEPSLEPRRPGAFQSRREPRRRRGAVRLRRHLYDAAFGTRQGAASAAGPSAARVRRRREPRQAARAAAAGPARRRDMRLAPADGRCRRDLPSAALDPAGGDAPAGERRRAGGRRRGRAHAAHVAPSPPCAPAGNGNRRHARALEAWARRIAGFRGGDDAGRRAPERGGDAHAARRHRRPGAAARPMGRGRSRAAGAHDAAVPGGGGAGARAGADVCRGDADAGRRRGCRRHSRRFADVVACDRGAVAGGHAEGPARAGRCGGRSRPGAARNAAALSEGRRAVAASAVRARAGRVPGRRHGAGQDDPGPVAAAGAAAEEQRRRAAAVPAGGAGVAAGQLDRGDRAICPRPEGADRASFGDDGRGSQAVHAGAGGRARSGDHQLRHAAAHAGAVGDRVAPGDPRRGAGDQEPGCQANPGGQDAASAGTDRADRDAGREPPRRPVVDLRLHQSRGCSEGRNSSPATPSLSSSGPTTPTGRCASWCAPTSCGA